LFKSTLPLKLRWCLWKQYKKYPTFSFFYLINWVSPKLKLKRVETRIHKTEIWRSPFQWSFDGIFLGLTVFLKFLGTRLTLSKGQRRQGFNKFNKLINFLFQKCVFNGCLRLKKELQCSKIRWWWIGSGGRIAQTLRNSRRNKSATISCGLF